MIGYNVIELSSTRSASARARDSTTVVNLTACNKHEPCYGSFRRTLPSTRQELHVLGGSNTERTVTLQHRTISFRYIFHSSRQDPEDSLTRKWFSTENANACNARSGLDPDSFTIYTRARASNTQFVCRCIFKGTERNG